MDINQQTNTATSTISGELQLVIFDLAGEFYGVDIGDVREIIRMQIVTRIPGAPAFVEGVINLRGKVVPVLDLRKRLNRHLKDATKESRIVVVNIEGNDVGVMVDGVTEVLRIQLDSIEPPSSMITDLESDYLRGIAKLEAKLIILLDLNKALADISRGGLKACETANTQETNIALPDAETSGEQVAATKPRRSKSKTAVAA